MSSQISISLSLLSVSVCLSVCLSSWETDQRQSLTNSGREELKGVVSSIRGIDIKKEEEALLPGNTFPGAMVQTKLPL